MSTKMRLKQWLYKHQEYKKIKGEGEKASAYKTQPAQMNGLKRTRF